jgi:hypothetical protein
MNDLSTLTNGPRAHLSAGGERYAVHELTLGEMGELQAWVDEQFADPLELAQERMGKGLTPSQERYLLEIALRVACEPKALLGTPQADALVRSAEGTKVMLWLAIRKGRPGFTRGEASALFDTLRPGDLARAFEASGVEAALSDPKAETGGATTPP